MKWIASISSVVFSLASTVTVAAQECIVEPTYGYINTDGWEIEYDFKRLGEPVLASTAGAPGCYQLAIQTCRKFPSFVKYEYVNNRTGLSQIKSAVYCNWEYNDGFVDDSDGSVTKHTTEDNFYWLGDRRVFKRDLEAEETP